MASVHTRTPINGDPAARAMANRTYLREVERRAQEIQRLDQDRAAQARIDEDRDRRDDRRAIGLVLGLTIVIWLLGLGAYLTDRWDWAY